MARPGAYAIRPRTPGARSPAIPKSSAGSTTGTPPGAPPRPEARARPRSRGRVGTRRRTRRAIVEATSRLLAAGGNPSVNDIAAAADVSRRTIYTYFPTLDQLLLDATIGAMNVSVEAAIDSSGEPDARARIAAASAGSIALIRL